MSLLLVHGACHDGASWSPLVQALASLGLKAHTVDLPSAAGPGTPPAGVADDVRTIREALATHRPRVVLCHSYGGVPTTAAVRASDGVELIIYLAAFMPDTGESLNTVEAGDEEDDAWVVSGDELYIEAVDPLHTFYSTSPAGPAREMAATLRPHSLRAFLEEVEHAAWREIPAVYVVTRDDEAIPPARQRAMAARAGAVYEIDGDHSPFLGRPAEVAELVTTLCS
ncbi:alpha/beta fold hydrolase [Kineosporia sp. NBRC 101731]|uniref:alpha/beta fold hydrolase n=1 Tax=Kineosporia sp. NBRC 101731 TaxID=3032199 RepID=UPI0024A1EDF2|nr:alpha/beta fold hydrolase [Kineosporia sp. NBRC 101731]GLY31414.1 hypothetical protein Kisp02_47790 [Kineosporia sp. NBRC 101731]